MQILNELAISYDNSLIFVLDYPSFPQTLASWLTVNATLTILTTFSFPQVQHFLMYPFVKDLLDLEKLLYCGNAVRIFLEISLQERCLKLFMPTPIIIFFIPICETIERCPPDAAGCHLSQWNFYFFWQHDFLGQRFFPDLTLQWQRKICRFIILFYFDGLEFSSSSLVSTGVRSFNIS